MRPDIRRENSDIFVTTRIPFIDGLSEQIRRIARAAGIRCSFTSSTTLEEFKSHIMHAVYSITCATCESEYVGETLRALGVRQKEHQDAV